MTAIGVHPAIGYTNAFHFGPAILGCGVYFASITLTYRPAAITATAAVEAS